MDRNLVIDEADNGYIASYWKDDGGMIEHQTVFEIPETETGELEAVQNLLRFVMEHFGVAGSDHDHYRLQVDIVAQYVK